MSSWKQNLLIDSKDLLIQSILCNTTYHMLEQVLEVTSFNLDILDIWWRNYWTLPKFLSRNCWCCTPDDFSKSVLSVCGLCWQVTWCQIGWMSRPQRMTHYSVPRKVEMAGIDWMGKSESCSMNKPIFLILVTQILIVWQFVHFNFLQLSPNIRWVHLFSSHWWHTIPQL